MKKQLTHDSVCPVSRSTTDPCAAAPVRGAGQQRRRAPVFAPEKGCRSARRVAAPAPAATHRRHVHQEAQPRLGVAVQLKAEALFERCRLRLGILARLAVLVVGRAAAAATAGAAPAAASAAAAAEAAAAAGVQRVGSTAHGPASTPAAPAHGALRARCALLRRERLTGCRASTALGAARAN